MLNTTLLVPGVGFPAVGRTRSFIDFKLFSFIVMVILISLKTTILTNFNLKSVSGENFIAIGQG